MSTKTIAQKIFHSFIGIDEEESDKKVISYKRAVWTASFFAIFCSAYIAVGILSIGAFTIWDFGNGIIWTAGFDVTFFVAIYLLSDIFSEVLGFRATRLTSVIASIMSIITFGILSLVNIFASPEFTTIEGVKGGNSIWGLLPSTTLIMTVGGSIIFAVGDWVNDIVHKAFHSRDYGKNSYIRYLRRAIGSSIVGRFADLIMFNVLIATPLMYFGKIDWGWGSVFSSSFWFTLFIGNVVLAVVLQICLELIFSFPTYRITSWVRKVLEKADLDAGL